MELNYLYFQHLSCWTPSPPLGWLFFSANRQNPPSTLQTIRNSKYDTSSRFSHQSLHNQCDICYRINYPYNRNHVRRVRNAANVQSRSTFIGTLRGFSWKFACLGALRVAGLVSFTCEISVVSCKGNQTNLQAVLLINHCGFSRFSCIQQEYSICAHITMKYYYIKPIWGNY